MELRVQLEMREGLFLLMLLDGIFGNRRDAHSLARVDLNESILLQADDGFTKRCSTQAGFLRHVFFREEKTGHIVAGHDLSI